MNFFLDTNIMLGYIFKTDNWNSKSIEVFQHHAPKYSSCYAREECEHKYSSKFGKIIRELRKFQKQIRLAKSQEEVKQSLQGTSFVTKEILLKFLAKYETVFDTKELVKIFSNLKLKTESECQHNYQHVKENITFHTSKHPHREVAHALEICGLISEDIIDSEIVIDAHDLGLEKENLIFITSDYTHIISRKATILQNTSLVDIIGLGEFNCN